MSLPAPRLLASSGREDTSGDWEELLTPAEEDMSIGLGILQPDQRGRDMSPRIPLASRRKSGGGLFELWPARFLPQFISLTPASCDEKMALL
jgi:hypothetical protein